MDRLTYVFIFFVHYTPEYTWFATAVIASNTPEQNRPNHKSLRGLNFR